MTVELDVKLSRDLKRARKQVRGCITTLEDVRRHTPVKTEINAMLAQLRLNERLLTGEFNDVQARLRARLPVRKVALNG